MVRKHGIDLKTNNYPKKRDQNVLLNHPKCAKLNRCTSLDRVVMYNFLVLCHVVWFNYWYAGFSSSLCWSVLGFNEMLPSLGLLVALGACFNVETLKTRAVKQTEALGFFKTHSSHSNSWQCLLSFSINHFLPSRWIVIDTVPYICSVSGISLARHTPRAIYTQWMESSYHQIFHVIANTNLNYTVLYMLMWYVIYDFHFQLVTHWNLTLHSK